MRFLLVFSVLLFVGLLGIGSVGAALVTVADYPYGAYDNWVAAGSCPNAPHPSSSSTVSANYCTFQVVVNNTLLNSTELYLRKVGSPVGFIRASLYNVSGNYGTTAVPQALLDTCIVDLAMAGLQANFAMTKFEFGEVYTLYAGVTYAIVLSEVNETTCDGSNYPQWAFDQVGSYSGNGGYFASSSFTAWPSTDDDMCFAVYGNGGTAVGYVGGNIYVTEQVTEVTAEFNNTAVSAGDVVASGGVSVDVGGVSAEFNNTAVSAGAVSAGAVTAGDVTAGDVTAGDFTGNITITELVVSGGSSSGVAYDDVLFGFYFLIFMLIANFLLIMVPKVPLLNVLVGMFSIVLVGLTLTGYVDMEIPYHPWFELFLGFAAVIALLRARGSLD